MSSNSGMNESQKQLLKLLEYIDGTIDFARFAQDHGISTIEAARKRVKRAIQSNNLAVTTRGDTIGKTTMTATIAPPAPAMPDLPANPSTTRTPVKPRNTTNITTKKAWGEATKRKAVKVDDNDAMANAAIKKTKTEGRFADKNASNDATDKATEE